MHIQILGESQFCNAFCLLGPLLKNMMAYIKSHFGHLFDILDFSERICKVSVNLSFRRSYFLLRLVVKNMVAYGKSHFRHFSVSWLPGTDFLNEFHVRPRRNCMNRYLAHFTICAG